MFKVLGQKRWLRYTVLACLVVLVAVDLQSVVAHNAGKGYQLWYRVADLKKAPWDRSTVAVARTDTPGFPNPVDPDKLGKNITTQQVEDVVRLAVNLTGGMDKVIDADDNLVLLDPNWVTALPSGSGAITDNRVVRAVAKLIYEVNPNVEIVIADGSGGWVDPTLAKDFGNKGRVVDGTQIMGYKQMVKELRAEVPGIKVRLDDLNGPTSETVLVDVPGGGWYQDKYWTHELVANADKVISVPVMKIHGTRITAGLKNNIGIAPGARYGWSKNGLDHDPRVMDKTIVDMAHVGGIDYVVVDAITALEKNYTTKGSPLYRDMIVAGKDIVAVDAVCARLMGFNPEDIGHVIMASYTGMGIADLNRIDIVGETIESAAYLFQKNITHKEWLGRSEEGSSNRIWTVNTADERIDPATVPVPGKDGWTEPLYASDDFIDISQAFSERSGSYYYAFTHFSAPKDQTAELRVGSSAEMRVWIDGEMAYEWRGWRRLHKMPNDVITIDLEKGNHTLMVEMRKGTFNLTIAEPVPEDIPNPANPERYDGTRVHGLEFYL